MTEKGTKILAFSQIPTKLRASKWDTKPYLDRSEINRTLESGEAKENSPMQFANSEDPAFVPVGTKHLNGRHNHITKFTWPWDY
ncbi:hypothetical protein GcM3_107029 [Golovinomyces cichoracearum]|uniref:Uncharacterized protein n=1 Tax=Golovinomyces cichoracearum TaxID=62708 RepID=A0A420I9F5_9PEZI|nr:hypothetical protein GcM3_107029 [Golovinomyces cichoracearum]